MSRRIPPPPLMPGPLTRTECDQWNTWAREVTALLGGFSVAAPLQVAQDVSGVRHSLNNKAITNLMGLQEIALADVQPQTVSTTPGTLSCARPILVKDRRETLKRYTW